MARVCPVSEGAPPLAHPEAGRFLTVPQVAEDLTTSEVQIVSMRRRGDLRGTNLGRRGQWRVERATFEAFIQRGVNLQYPNAKELLAAPPLVCPASGMH